MNSEQGSENIEGLLLQTYFILHPSLFLACLAGRQVQYSVGAFDANQKKRTSFEARFHPLLQVGLQTEGIHFPDDFFGILEQFGMLVEMYQRRNWQLGYMKFRSAIGIRSFDNKQ